MPSRNELLDLYKVGSRLTPAIHQVEDWPYETPHDLYEAYMQPPQDVGGQMVAPAPFEDKEEEVWEEKVYVTCEVLAWRDVWSGEERRRRADNDVGLSLYYGFPYYGRWIWSAARMLVDKKYISPTELFDKIAEVRARHATHRH